MPREKGTKGKSGEKEITLLEIENNMLVDKNKELEDENKDLQAKLDTQTSLLNQSMYINTVLMQVFNGQQNQIMHFSALVIQQQQQLSQKTDFIQFLIEQMQKAVAQMQRQQNEQRLMEAISPLVGGRALSDRADSNAEDRISPMLAEAFAAAAASSPDHAVGDKRKPDASAEQGGDQEADAKVKADNGGWVRAVRQKRDASPARNK